MTAEKEGLIIRLTRNLVQEVSRLHCQLFPEAFLQEVGYGYEFQRDIFYDAMVHSKEAVCFLCLMGVKIVGFVGVVKDARHFYRQSVFLKHWGLFLKLACLTFLKRAGLISNFFDRAISVSRYLGKDGLSQIPWAVVCFGVLPEYRKTLEIDGRRIRVSRELFRVAAEQFKKWGAEQFKLFTPTENKVALIFYSHRGGKVSGTFNSLKDSHVGIWFDTEEVLQRLGFF